jgi:hypothetical protein
MHHDRKLDVSATCVWLLSLVCYSTVLVIKVDFVHILWISKRRPLLYIHGSAVGERQVAIVSVRLCLRIT